MDKEKTTPETEETAEAVEEVTEEPKKPEKKKAEKKPKADKKSAEIEKLKEELGAEKDKYIRLYAEYDNYRKRTSAEKLQIYDDATARAIKEILPMADSVTQALAQFEGKDVPEEFSKGIELIAQQLKASLEKLKVEAFCEVGDTFDPELHNAVSMTEDENLPENSIAAVYQKGYKVGDKIIRHAMVVVANA
ncbi:MAG: nucleotide exchange factor GrpE [Ruminococcus sp.]|nr:nucleotide exchange factor GrpE [Ruminococcus sp.]